jgi:hypothetical protein
LALRSTDIQLPDYKENFQGFPSFAEADAILLTPWRENYQPVATPTVSGTAFDPV